MATLKDLRITETIVTDSKRHEYVLDTVKNVDPARKFGWGTVYVSCKAALTAFEAGKFDPARPAKRMVKAMNCEALTTRASLAYGLIEVGLMDYLPRMSDNALSRADYAAYGNKENRLRDLTEQIKVLETRIATVEVVPTSSTNEDWSADVKAFEQAYKTMGEDAYLKAAQELKGKITQHGYAKLVSLKERKQEQLEEMRNNRYMVAGQYYTTTKNGDTKMQGYRVIDTHTLEAFAVKTERAGSAQVATREFTYNLIGRLFIEPAYTRYMHEHGTHTYYQFKMDRVKETETIIR